MLTVTVKLTRIQKPRLPEASIDTTVYLRKRPYKYRRNDYTALNGRHTVHIVIFPSTFRFIEFLDANFKSTKIYRYLMDLPWSPISQYDHFFSIVPT